VVSEYRFSSRIASMRENWGRTDGSFVAGIITGASFAATDLPYLVNVGSMD